MDDKAIRDFLDGRKSVHVKLLSETRTALRATLYARGLSMQEVFEALAKRIAMNDPTMEVVIDELAEQKGQSYTDRTGRMNVDMVFDAIDRVSPLDDEESIV